jgi:hypothetical protein
MQKPLFKTTVVIWSTSDPTDRVELSDLACDAEVGASYCSVMRTVRVEDPAADPDMDDTEFFGAQDDDTADDRDVGSTAAAFDNAVSGQEAAPLVATPSLVQRLSDRTGDLDRILADGGGAMIELMWQLIAAEVRQVVPEATGLRLDGNDTEDGLRLSLDEVLIDGQPASVEKARFGQLQAALDGPLLYLAEHEAEEVLRDQQDRDLPVLILPGNGLLFALPLLDDGELRVFAPDPAEGDLGRMWVLDVLGVLVLIRQRADGLYVHVDADATSQPVSTVLLVEVNNGGEQECSP